MYIILQNTVFTFLNVLDIYNSKLFKYILILKCYDFVYLTIFFM